MSLGVFGVGNWVRQSVMAQLLLAGAGALFLMWYGVGVLRRAFQSQVMDVDGQIAGESSTVPAPLELYFLVGASLALV